MANVGWQTPYTDHIIWTQVLPQFFNQPYARGFGYQILITLGTNFIGYGIAGVCRRFLVYPSYCVWPASLVTIALNNAFHAEKNEPVASPFNRIFTVSRMRFFALSFAAMFVWFWFPNYIFQALSVFNWISFSEWFYFSLLVAAVGVSCAGIAGWETYTSVGVVFYGIALCLIFVVPIGIVAAMTGIEVTLNVLAEFIGGAWVAGNALAMNYFKSYGYVTCAHALRFSNDLKLAHYVKIPPRHTFAAQTIATFLSTFVCVGVINFQINEIPDVCQPNQKNRFTCPDINTFFTAAVLWGTLGPHKMFGTGGQYTALLMGFPIGLLLPFVVYYAQKHLPKQKWLRQVHPVVLLYGPLNWAPYNLSYAWPSVPIGYFSMVYLKKRYLAFWSKASHLFHAQSYNYILSASWSSAIAIAAIIIFFGLQWSEVEIKWWGNSVSYQGCEDIPCTRLELAEGEYFGPGIGEFK
ncbi:hypothetical protein QTJ16_006890 [Diplocarpon rosae]|uniref:Uncharacterized protein n=1 Tax=Diplocarpon rosae TaxID=946125 RepID=A0AAD9SVH6_9HELO|nr:hypothetical protein QTJ16_006890 [Diplocarpon rosae]